MAARRGLLVDWGGVLTSNVFTSFAAFCTAEGLPEEAVKELFLGDPLADLGYLCTLWTDRDDPDLGMFELSAVTRQEGFPRREELIARYEEGSGRSMTDIRWYQTLALWKSVVFMEGNYKRAVSGQTDDPFLKTFGDGVVQLARRAEEVARGGA